MRFLPSAVLWVVAVLVLTGCRSDPARDRSSQAIDLLMNSRARLLLGDRAVEASLKDLNALRSAQADLRPAFEAFRSHIPKLLAEADRVRIESGDIGSRADAHVEAWRADLGTITNQQLRQAGEDRAQEVRDRYTQIAKLYAAVNAAYLEYITQAKDLETYLANDLNFPALQKVSTWTGKTADAGVHLRNRIDALATELSTTTNVLSPVPVPQRGPTTTAPATTQAVER
jgi:hypothetical protein